MASELHSTFGNLFTALQEYLLSLVGDGIYIDQDLGQLRNSTRPPVTWPCILIDFEDFTFENLGNNVQTAKGTVVIQLGFAPYSNSSQNTPDNYKQQALTYYDYEYFLHWALQGWSPLKEAGSLIRTSVTTQQRKDHYRVREMRYSLAFEDYTTEQVPDLASVTLVLTDQMNLPLDN